MTKFVDSAIGSFDLFLESGEKILPGSHFWRYNTGDISADEAYGKEFDTQGRVGRTFQLKQIWTVVRQQTMRNPTAKSAAYYIHASPGMGKTFLFREMMNKEAEGLQDAEVVSTIKDTFLLPVDFNRNSCGEIATFALKIKDLPQCFVPLARAYYVQFANQQNLSWYQFFSRLMEAISKRELSATSSVTTMMANIKAKASGRPIIVVVDEIQKAQEIDKDFDFPARFRSVICSWADASVGFCSGVVFSSLDRELMTNERTASNRAMISITSLPLLTTTEAKTILRRCIPENWEFEDVNALEVQRDFALEILAVASGGHPRSIEFIIQECITSSHQNRTHMLNVITEAGKKLLGAYNRPPSWTKLVAAALLAEPVQLKGTISSDDGTITETYESLVNRGLIVSSLEDDSESFTPEIPEIFLVAWCSMLSTDVATLNMKRCLHRVLENRRGFTRKKWETLHSDWQCLMRYVRPSSYARSPLRELYRYKADSEQPRQSLTMNIHVDGKTPLSHVRYHVGKIVVQPNTIIHPESDSQPGWDKLIILEAFPQSRKCDTNKKFLLPVFEQNKFSKDESATTLSSGTIEKALHQCASFFTKNLSLPEGFHWLPQLFKWSAHFPFVKGSSLDPFVMTFIAKMRPTESAKQSLPRNVLLLAEDDMENMYGPMIVKFIKSLVPDSETYLVYNPSGDEKETDRF
jgi:hypothetical protein